MSGVNVEQLTDEELKLRGVYSWAIWNKEPSEFDWFYESVEQCYFLQGHVIVETEAGNIEIKKGDFVTFPKGLKCVWRVQSPVKKHYQFG